MGFTIILVALLIAAPALLAAGSQETVYYGLPRDAQCVGDRQSITAAGNFWAIQIQDGNPSPNQFLAHGEAKVIKDGDTLMLEGSWAADSISQNDPDDKVIFVGLTATFSGRMVADVTKCGIDNEWSKYNNVLGSMTIKRVSGETIHAITQQSMPAQIGNYAAYLIGDDGGSVCTCNPNYGFGAWLQTDSGPVVEMSLQLETLDECVAAGVDRFVAINHRNGAHINDFKSPYGIVINQLFNSWCIDNAKLGVGYNGFMMRDVTVEVAENGVGKRMFGVVDLLEQTEGEKTVLFRMYLAAEWSGGAPGTFTISDETDEIYGGFAQNDNNNVQFFATLTEVMNGANEPPLVIELKEKAGSQYTYNCQENILNKGPHACHGWLWSRIASAGRYGNGVPCDRCRWEPMPVDDTDFLFEVERVCEPARPLPAFPAFLPLLPAVCCPEGSVVTPDGNACEQVCNFFSVEPFNSQCTSTPKNQDANAHVLYVPPSSEYGGSYKVGQGALSRPRTGELRIQGDWQTADLQTTAIVDAYFVRVLEPDPSDMKVEHPCTDDGKNGDWYKYYTLDLTKTNTITFETSTGLVTWEIVATPMYAQEGISANAKEKGQGCCEDEVPGFSTWLDIRPQGSTQTPIKVDINAHLICADCENYEYATSNSASDWIAETYGFQNGHGLVVNELFKDTCVTNLLSGYNNLDFGYSSFDFVNVKTKYIPAAETINNINRIEMKGTVKAYTSIENSGGGYTSQYLFDMHLDAYWEGNSLEADVFGIKGQVFSADSSKAYLTEIVNGAAVDPLIVELVGKPTSDGTTHIFRCSGKQCKGWTMAKIVQRGRYGSVEQCECEVKAVEYSDWGVQLKPDCESGMPVVPEVPVVEEVCVCPEKIYCIDGREGEIRNGKLRVETTSYRIEGLVGSHEERAMQLGLPFEMFSYFYGWAVLPIDPNDESSTYILNLSGNLDGYITICGEKIRLFSTKDTCRCVGDPHFRSCWKIDNKKVCTKNNNGGLFCANTDNNQCGESTVDSGIIVYQTSTIMVATNLNRHGQRGSKAALNADKVVATNRAVAVTFLDQWTYICEPSGVDDNQSGPPICKLYLHGDVYNAPLCIQVRGNMQRLRVPTGEVLVINSRIGKAPLIDIRSISSTTANENIQGVCKMQSKDSIEDFGHLRVLDLHYPNPQYDQTLNKLFSTIDLPECEALSGGWATVFPDEEEIDNGVTRRRRALEEAHMPEWLSIAEHHIHTLGFDDNEKEELDDAVVRRRSTDRTYADEAADTGCAVVSNGVDIDCGEDTDYEVAMEACALDQTASQTDECLKEELKEEEEALIAQDDTGDSAGSSRRSAEYLDKIRYLASLDIFQIMCASDPRDYSLADNKCKCPGNRVGATCAVKKGQKVKIARAHKLGRKVRGNKRRVNKGQNKKHCVDSEGSVSFQLYGVDMDFTCDVSLDGEIADAQMIKDLVTVNLPKLQGRKTRLVMRFKGPGLPGKGQDISMKLSICQ